jgi:rod shape-determining protein MreD
MTVTRLLATVLIVVTAAVLQTALFPSLTLLGFRPDLLLLVVVAIALHEGPVSGAALGAFAGLVTDLLVTQAPLGLGVLVFAAIGHGVGQARPYLAPGSISAPLLLAFTSGVTGTAAYGALASLLGDDRVTSRLLLQASLAVGLYNTLLAPIVLGVVRRLFERFPMASARADRPHHDET